MPTPSVDATRPQPTVVYPCSPLRRSFSVTILLAALGRRRRAIVRRTTFWRASYEIRCADVPTVSRVVEVLEDRTLLSAHPTITVLGTASAGGYKFLDFDGPNAGTNAAAGSNDNGIANSGTVVGFDIDNTGGFHNFTVNPLKSQKVQELNINGSTTAQAFGINRAGVVVGTDGNGNAFYLSNGKVHTFIPLGGSAATAFGINDHGTIIGQYTDGAEMPGFICPIAQHGHPDRRALGARHRQRPGDQQQRPDRRLLRRHRRPGPRLHRPTSATRATAS